MVTHLNTFKFEVYLQKCFSLYLIRERKCSETHEISHSITELYIHFHKTSLRGKADVKSM